MSSRVIETPDAPGAIGPYVQARVAGNMLWTSGCVAIDPRDGSTPESIEEQTALSLKNLQALLDASGFKKEDVVMCQIYIADLDNFQKMNKVYAEFWGDHKPCRCTVEAGRLCDPFKVELFIQAVH